MMYRLIILTGPSTGVRITIESNPMVIGRDPDCAVRVEDPEVSRKHAVIEHRPDGIYIRDLGSMNRILVNKREVRETRLKHGDTIEVGLTRFLVQALVQADVTDEERIEQHARKMTWAPVAGAILLLALVVGGVWTLIRKDSQKPAVQPLDIPETTSVAVAAIATAELAATVVAVETAKPPSVNLRESLQPVSEELRLVREDLADLRETMKTLAVQPAPPPPAPAAAPLQEEASAPAPSPVPGLRMIRIASVEQQKFPANEEFDEMRMLNISLVSAVPPEEIDPAAVRVEVFFFDQDSSGRVSPTRAIAPKEPLTLDGTWGQEPHRLITATYVVPAGFRDREDGKYYGYRIRVFYGDEIADADARPKTLLDGVENGATGTTTNPPKADAEGGGSS